MKKITALFVLFLMAFTYSAMADKVDDIIKANLKAHGGEKAYKEMKTMYAEMEISVMGMNMPMKLWSQNPDKMRIEQSAMGQEIIVVNNGNKGWMKMGGNVQEIPEEQLAQSKAQNPVNDIISNNPFIDYKAKGIDITHAGTEVVNGKNCDILAVKFNESMTLKFFIDQSTNLELKYKVEMALPAEAEESEDSEEAEMMAGMMQPEMFVNEWMTVDGIKVPKSMDMKMGMMNSTIKYNKMEFNKAIDAKMFEKP